MRDEGTIKDRVVGSLVIAAHAVRRTFVFSGHSRRTEFLCYWLVSMIAATLINEAAKATLDWETADGVGVAAGILMLLPVFGLIARRFHDMGLTGWLALPMLPTAVMGTYMDYWYRFTPPDVMIEGYPYDGVLWSLLSVPGMIVFFWALFGPGQMGKDNRYGSDPRLRPTGPEAELAVG